MIWFTNDDTLMIMEFVSFSRLNHPVKKFKLAEPKVEPIERNQNRKLMSQSSSFGYGNNNNNSNNSTTYPARTVNSPPEQLFIKQEPNDSNAADTACSSGSSSNNVATSAIRFKTDPFSFEDAGGGMNMGTFKRSAPSPLSKVSFRARRSINLSTM